MPDGTILSILLRRSAVSKHRSIDWDLLSKQACIEHVLPALAQQGAARAAPDALPIEIQAIFNAAESFNSERNDTILAEAVHAVCLLNHIGIQRVALKGLAYLLTGTYPNPAARYLLDIDLLLPPQHLPLAAEHPCRNGYFRSESAAFLQFRYHYPAIRRTGHLTLNCTIS